jgi:hypothetical protein
MRAHPQQKPCLEKSAAPRTPRVARPIDSPARRHFPVRREDVTGSVSVVLDDDVVRGLVSLFPLFTMLFVTLLAALLSGLVRGFRPARHDAARRTDCDQRSRETEETEEEGSHVPSRCNAGATSP